VDNRREDITDGSISDHLATRFIHVCIYIYIYVCVCVCVCEMARSNNELLTEKIKITAFWDIMPCTVACIRRRAKCTALIYKQTRKPCGKSSMLEKEQYIKVSDQTNKDQ